MAPRGRRLAALAAAAAAAVAAGGCRGTSEAPNRPAPATIRVAVIGGMVETGLWAAVAERFQLLTGHRVELVASGPKSQVVAAFRRGGIELITASAVPGGIRLQLRAESAGRVKELQDIVSARAARLPGQPPAVSEL